MTAHGTRDSALDAVRRGAYDYFTKPFSLDEMEIIVRRALEKKRLLAELDRAAASSWPAGARRGRIVGSSRAMEEVLRLIDRVGPTDSTVLILGESGTGKELIAEAIHEQLNRRGKPFVKLNCAAIPETLLESELFGHEKGAFTGAVSRKLGKFEQADGGTLLLDEIGDMTLATQAKILRALQERELQRVGGTQTIKVDVRILASTNKDLEKAVKRRHVPRRPVLPPERRDDPGAAAARSARRDSGARRPFPRGSEHAAEAEHPRLAPDTLAALMEYGWPGNVRELRNMIERAAVVNDGDVLALSSFPPPIRPADPPAGRPAAVGDAAEPDPRREGGAARARLRRGRAGACRRRAGRRRAAAGRDRAIGLAPGEEAPDRGRRG